MKRNTSLKALHIPCLYTVLRLRGDWALGCMQALEAPFTRTRFQIYMGTNPYPCSKVHGLHGYEAFHHKNDFSVFGDVTAGSPFQKYTVTHRFRVKQECVSHALARARLRTRTRTCTRTRALCQRPRALGRLLRAANLTYKPLNVHVTNNTSCIRTAYTSYFAQIYLKHGVRPCGTHIHFTRNA